MISFDCFHPEPADRIREMYFVDRNIFLLPVKTDTNGHSSQGKSLLRGNVSSHNGCYFNLIERGGGLVRKMPVVTL